MEVCNKRNGFQSTTNEGTTKPRIEIWMSELATCYEIWHFKDSRAKPSKAAGPDHWARKMRLGWRKISWSELSQSINHSTESFVEDFEKRFNEFKAHSRENTINSSYLHKFHASPLLLFLSKMSRSHVCCVFDFLFIFFFTFRSLMW